MQTTVAKKPYIPDAWETVPCPFCNSTEYSVYERFGSEMQYTYVLCKNCRLVYTSPRPVYNKHFIDAAYAEYYQYAEELKAEDFENIPESGLNMFKKEMQQIIRYDTKRSLALDIGSGMGTFLLAAKPYYKEVMGLDVSEKMAAFIKRTLGINIYIKQLEDFDYPEKFSMIHMSHVLEHIPNPNEWLQKARTLLTDGGILVINVPNKFSFSYRLQYFFYKLKLKKQFSSSWSDPSRTPDHLVEPTIPSMLYLIKKNGFDVLEYYSYSRKDPVSNQSLFSKFMNRFLKVGSNLAFITTPKKY
ncbi:MAG: class I SAM-dependent methyltransferase [Chitinophagaceae bacterium]